MKKKSTYLNNPYTGYFFILPQFLFFAVFTIEQNRCAMACQGCGAVFTFL
ncbi:MAG: hypothetical protein HFG43_15095 [Lachnospiraceae bacterium]|nr:hypothetical protein [Lachnospiraceae bacterium]